MAAAQHLALVSPALRPAPKRRRRSAGRLEDLPPRQKDWLAALRLSGLSCRAAARLDVFSACAGLAMGQSGSAADALVRALPEAMGAPVTLFRPGETALSFDETWLLALIDAQARSDAESGAFLLASRIVPHLRRNVGFLARAVAKARMSG